MIDVSVPRELRNKFQFTHAMQSKYIKLILVNILLHHTIIWNAWSR